jgi:hypothetical protein
MRVLLEARFSCLLVYLTHAACAECSVPVSCAKDHRSEAEGQGERQSQRYRCILQVRDMLPLEQPKKEEDNTWQVTQARIGCHTKEAALLLGVKPIKVLVHSIVHIDADEPFRDGVQSDPVRFVSSQTDLDSGRYSTDPGTVLRELVPLEEEESVCGA